MHFAKETFSSQCPLVKTHFARVAFNSNGCSQKPPVVISEYWLGKGNALLSLPRKSLSGFITMKTAWEMMWVPQEVWHKLVWSCLSSKDLSVDGMQCYFALCSRVFRMVESVRANQTWRSLLSQRFCFRFISKGIDVDMDGRDVSLSILWRWYSVNIVMRVAHETLRLSKDS